MDASSLIDLSSLRSIGGYYSRTTFSGTGGAMIELASGLSDLDDVGLTVDSPTSRRHEFGAPAWAALIALVDQDRLAANPSAGTLDGSKQTLPAIYSLPASDFHDVTVGYTGLDTNGNSVYGKPGYDLITGLGSKDDTASHQHGSASTVSVRVHESGSSGGFSSAIQYGKFTGRKIRSS